MPDNKLIIRAGEALWGEQWQAAMARALEVHKDTVQDWRQGRNSPRPSVYVDLLRIATDRAVEIDSLLDALKAVGGGQ